MDNARNVKREYLDPLYCAVIDDYPVDNIGTEFAQHVCHDLEKLRNCQIASAVS